MATKRNGQVSNGLPNNMCIAHDTGGSMLEPGWSQDHHNLEKKGQSLATKSFIALGYKFTQYLFIRDEF